MRQPFAAGLAGLALFTAAQSTPVLAAEPPGASAVVEALDLACRLYVEKNDYAGYVAKAGELEIRNFYGTLARRAPGVDIFAVSATADAPFARRCTIAIDGPPAVADPTPAAVATWAKAGGFKPDGAPKTLTDANGQPYKATFWKSPKGQLQVNVFGPNAKGRVNVTATWSVRD